ncbi:hypothetical protein [Microbacterium oleivorans]|uniref:Major tail protein n=1 Tax=Microbacterium oleivorans TaxID=273677 RepID=A0A4V3B372_9MICO|nr:hypothetical protein [Microbacterium oleivorans]TDL43600.1 hypothetical protein E2R54_10325 [Microbacterium oleivorans]
MGSTRIKGNRKPVLTLGAPGSEFSADVISWSIENEEADSDVITFEDAANGGSRQYFLRGSAIQSTQTASFWRYVWENAGDTDVPFTIAPHGNATPSASEPHLVGTLTIGPKPTIGAEASTSASSASTFDYEFQIDGIPVLDVAP